MHVKYAILRRLTTIPPDECIMEKDVQKIIIVAGKNLQWPGYFSAMYNLQ